MKKIILAFLFFISISNSFAQMPNTDIWLLDISSVKDSIILSNPVNITDRVGYDNQPAFSPDGKYILYTSMHDAKQSDIYKYDLKTKVITQFTNTITSEYSPTFMPDGKNISVVMVEPDSAQRLWKFPLKVGAPTCIMKDVDSIGYHCWIDSNNVALFLITDPFQLVFSNILTGKSKVIVHDTIARGMNLIKGKGGDKFFYAYKDFIYSVYPDDNEMGMTRWGKKMRGEDFTFLNSHFMVMADISRIYKAYFLLPNEKDFHWKVTIDLAKYGISNITRLAVSPDGKKLAIVAESKQ